MKSGIGILFNSLPLPVCEFDAEGHITLANRSGFETFGYSREDYDKDSTVLQLAAPEDSHKVAENIQRIMSGERLGGTDYTLIKKDGSTFPAIVFSSLVLKENRFTGLQTIMIDITERKQAAEALRESEERFRLMTENLRDSIWMMDMDLQYTYMSPYVKHILGYDPEKYVTIPLQDVMTPASLELNMQLMVKKWRQKKGTIEGSYRTRTIEIEHISKDGKIICADIKMTFIRDITGRAIGILGITRDITDRKHAENALKASEEKYRTLTNNIPDLIYSLDSHGNITTVSEDVLKRYGYDIKDVMGRSFRDFIHPEDRDRVLSTFRSVIDERREFVRGLQFRGLAKDGSSYWFD